jgi:hypothetical protein
MTGPTWIALAAFAVATVLSAVWAARRQRHGAVRPEARPLSPVTPGARAFVSHMGSLSDLRVGLRPPPRGEGWRRLSTLGSVR